MSYRYSSSRDSHDQPVGTDKKLIQPLIREIERLESFKRVHEEEAGQAASKAVLLNVLIIAAQVCSMFVDYTKLSLFSFVPSVAVVVLVLISNGRLYVKQTFIETMVIRRNLVHDIDRITAELRAFQKKLETVDLDESMIEFKLREIQNRFAGRPDARI
jgi:ABC-type multidrug transport system fused ATPase/permease subunit